MPSIYLAVFSLGVVSGCSLLKAIRAWDKRRERRNEAVREAENSLASMDRCIRNHSAEMANIRIRLAAIEAELA